ncbi:MAG: Crp/Fnr family transcriptional regulator [Bacteroides sp.]|jgi:cAMP-binding DNA-binding protein|uniref:Crp/Fnr family transcriptional regulator n=1 Tax=Bacteroides TaxID=816 RepID=UPI0025BEB34B|nr:Crp/Fnr family transcriptional regulator [Bacteroides sp.]MBS6238019.1 Crp/Fnr family transcriptional regulator [Bacteroides sp.]
MNNIIRKIREYYPVPDDSLDTLKSYLRQQTFPVKTIIIQAGKLDRRIYLIEKGITRSYILHNGKETTTWFSMEGDATCGSWDLYRNKAGFEYVETLEKTLVYSISIDTLNTLYQKDIHIANWMRVLQQENFLWLQEMHINRLTLSVKERYIKLLQDFPNIYNRVNLGYIASYLGTTLPTLSKIRSELVMRF